ncbi:hypothetical protein GCM10028868_24970 [Virgibacillus kimchii]
MAIWIVPSRTRGTVDFYNLFTNYSGGTMLDFHQTSLLSLVFKRHLILSHYLIFTLIKVYTTALK